MAAFAGSLPDIHPGPQYNLLNDTGRRWMLGGHAIIPETFPI
jgi:hypothetical protein